MSCAALVGGESHARYNGVSFSGEQAFWERIAVSTEAAILAEMHATSLHYTTEVQQYTIRSYRTRLDVQGGVPCTNVVEVKINDEVRDLADVYPSWWSLGLKTQAPIHASVSLDLQLGWQREEDLPPLLLEAILEAGSAMYDTQGRVGREVTGERIGDYSVTYQSRTDERSPVITNSVMAKLRPFINPELSV